MKDNKQSFLNFLPMELNINNKGEIVGEISIANVNNITTIFTVYHDTIKRLVKLIKSRNNERLTNDMKTIVDNANDFIDKHLEEE